MKHLIVALTLLSASLLAQPVPAASSAKALVNAPNYDQLYCAGFLSKKTIPRRNIVLGSKESPHEDMIVAHSALFIGGPALVEGQRYSILRKIEDQNLESFSDQSEKLSTLGHLYQDVGWATVHSVEKGSAIASFDFACGEAIAGDIVVPYEEKPKFKVREVEPPLDSFHATRSAVHGRLLITKGFENLIGTGQIVYTNFGSAKGAKPGDYLLVLRGYGAKDLGKTDRLSEILPQGSDVINGSSPTVTASAQAHLPLQVLGEMLVLNSTAESSTALITRSSAEIGLGDLVENENPQAATAASTSEAAEAAPCQPSSRLHRLTHLQRHACPAAK